ncbi:MAG: hypothetical protein EOR57_14230 [Mesorhizobium sp.]|uniref:hypothetical protein n=1 Tax=Mesorhizobium sp. TaxID=1871066 RepID=UPI000FE46BBF|nr:hypothetical protein [Mesorhizobium sp.]RWL19747.1 MAG: hypothetical protein EOR57_14230 [Mesorhizobium sp.]
MKGRLYPFAISIQKHCGVAMTSFLDKRRSKLSPSEQRAAQEEVRRQIAVAVSVTKRKTKAEVQAKVLEAPQIASEPQP